MRARTRTKYRPGSGGGETNCRCADPVSYEPRLLSDDAVPTSTMKLDHGAVAALTFHESVTRPPVQIEAQVLWRQRRDVRDRRPNQERRIGGGGADAGGSERANTQHVVTVGERRAVEHRRADVHDRDRAVGRAVDDLHLIGGGHERVRTEPAHVAVTVLTSAVIAVDHTPVAPPVELPPPVAPPGPADAADCRQFATVAAALLIERLLFWLFEPVVKPLLKSPGFEKLAMRGQRCHWCTTRPSRCGSRAPDPCSRTNR